MMAENGSGTPAPADAPIPDPRLTSQGAVSDEALRKAEEFVEAEEGAANRLVGIAGVVVTLIAVAMTLFHLYAAYDIVPTQPLRYAHVAFVLVLCFLLFPLAARFRNRVQVWDVVAAAASVAILIYAIWGGEDFTDRATTPTQFDVVLGVVFIVLLLEATRRTSGWIMPVVAILFIAYAMLGPYLPPPWTHRGYTFSRLVGHLFITLEGIFGVAVDVSSSLIILFTIYGAFLQHSGAGKFFIDWSLALMGGKPNSAGRTVVLSSFLLGGPSGSGVATTVTIGAVAYPMMQRAGFEKNAAGGRLARRHPVAAGAGRRRLPDRRVSQDQLPRRDLDGDHPDLPLLPVAAVHGRARRQALRLGDGALRHLDVAVADDQALRFPFHVADRGDHLHGGRLLADAVGVLLDLDVLRAERADAGDRAGAAT